MTTGTDWCCMGRKSRHYKQQPDPLPDVPEFMYLSGATKAIRPYAMVVVDNNGHLVRDLTAHDILLMVNGGRVESGTHHLTYRDVRQALSCDREVVSIEARRNCIVLCVPPIVAIICGDKVILQVNDGMRIDTCISILNEMVRTYLHQKAKPREEAETKLVFEIAALEVCLTLAFWDYDCTYTRLASEVHLLNAMGNETGGNMERKMNIDRIRKWKESMGNLHATVSMIGKMFDELMTDKPTLYRMELSRFYDRPQLYEIDSDWCNPDIENLVEHFDQEVENLLKNIKAAMEIVLDAERSVEMKLDVARNKLLRLQVTLQVITGIISFLSLNTGLFGMNMLNKLETNDDVFPWMYGVSFVLVFVAPAPIYWLLSACGYLS